MKLDYFSVTETNSSFKAILVSAIKRHFGLTDVSDVLHTDVLLCRKVLIGSVALNAKHFRYICFFFVAVLYTILT